MQRSARTSIDSDVATLQGYPVVGSAPKFVRDPLSTLLGALREGGDMVRINLGVQSSTLLSRPEHVERVLKSNAKNYIKGYDNVRAILGDGLTLIEGEHWRRQRHLMQPAFHRRHLARLAETMVEETEKALERWEPHAAEGRPLDIEREMTLVARNVILKVLFGSIEGAKSERITRAVDTALSGLEFRALAPLWLSRLPLPANRRLKRALATFDEAVMRIIGERRRRGLEPDSLVSMLVAARDEETGETMSDRQVRDEVMTLFFAGHRSTASLASWVWYLLSQHPDVARKVRQEVLGILGDGPPDVEDLPKLAYTRMVLDETLRLYPPAWSFFRQSIEDDEVGGHHFPAGSLVWLSPYVTHRRADLWENPEGFDPERFRPGAGEGRPRFAYFPFGGGPRLCIGRNFALMEAALVVAAVARRYRLDLVPGQHVTAQPRSTHLKPHRTLLMVPRIPTTAP